MDTSLSVILTIFIITLSNANYAFFTGSYPDHHTVIRPILKEWSNATRSFKKLAIVLDDYDGNIIDVPRDIFQEFNATTSLATLDHLMSLDLANNSPDYHSMGTGNFVLLLTPDIGSVGRIIRTPHLKSFWRPENYYVLQEIGEGAVSYDASHSGFLEWSLERLWRLRKIYKLLVQIGDKTIRFDPFAFENHLGRYICNETGDWYCVKYQKKYRTILSVRDANATGVFRYIRDYRDGFDLYPIKISIFPSPTMIKIPGGYEGVDSQYMDEICKALNVTPVHRLSSTYGWTTNGMFFGSIGDIHYKHADVSFNAFFLKDYLTKELETSVALTSDFLCVVVPKALPIPEHLVIFRCFTLESWILVFTGHLVISMLYAIVKRNKVYESRGGVSIGNLNVSEKRGRSETGVDKFRGTRCQFARRYQLLGTLVRTAGKEGCAGMRSHGTGNVKQLAQDGGIEKARGEHPEGFKGFHLSHLVSLSNHSINLVLQLTQPFETPGSWASERMLITCGLFLSLILNGVFTSQLASNFSTVNYYEDIHTLEELERSGLTIFTASRDLFDDALTDADSSLIKRLRERMVYANRTEIHRRLFVTRDAGVLHPKLLVPLTYTELEAQKLHIVEECPKTYIISLLMTKASPFSYRMNSVIGRLNNGGFYDKWFRNMFRTMKKPVEKSRVYRDLTIHHLCIPFAILAIGLAISTIVFVCEIRRNDNPVSSFGR